MSEVNPLPLCIYIQKGMGRHMPEPAESDGLGATRPQNIDKPLRH